MKAVFFLMSIVFIVSCHTIDTGHTGGLNPYAIKSSVKVFDLRKDRLDSGGEDPKVIEEMLAVFANPEPVYIEWNLRFSNIESFEYSNGILSRSSVDKSLASKDSGLASYSVPMNHYSTHFVFDVLIGSASQFPFNAVSYYRSASGDLSITIQGYYTGIRYSIPTATALELRPINPYLIIPSSSSFSTGQK